MNDCHYGVIYSRVETQLNDRSLIRLGDPFRLRPTLPVSSSFISRDLGPVWSGCSAVGGSSAVGAYRAITSSLDHRHCLHCTVCTVCIGPFTLALSVPRYLASLPPNRRPLLFFFRRHEFSDIIGHEIIVAKKETSEDLKISYVSTSPYLTHYCLSLYPVG